MIFEPVFQSLKEEEVGEQKCENWFSLHFVKKQKKEN